MSAGAESQRTPPLLAPPDRRAVWALLTALVLAAAAAVVIAWMAADLRARPAILRRLGGEATLAVMSPTGAPSLESSDAAAWRSAEILAARPGVAKVRVIDPAPGDPAIAATMGARVSPEEPARLIAVIFAPGPHPTARDLLKTLAREGVLGVADDHGWLTGPVERQTFFAAAACGDLGLGLLLAFVATAVLATRRRARALTSRLALLSRLGMADGDLMVRLAAPVALGALGAAILGTGLGCLTLGLFGADLAGPISIIPRPGLEDLLFAALWAPAEALLAAVAILAIAARAVQRIWP